MKTGICSSLGLSWVLIVEGNPLKETKMDETPTPSIIGGYDSQSVAQSIPPGIDRGQQVNRTVSNVDEFVRNISEDVVTPNLLFELIRGINLSSIHTEPGLEGVPESSFPDNVSYDRQTARDVRAMAVLSTTLIAAPKHLPQLGGPLSCLARKYHFDFNVLTPLQGDNLMRSIRQAIVFLPERAIFETILRDLHSHFQNDSYEDSESARNHLSEFLDYPKKEDLTPQSFSAWIHRFLKDTADHSKF